MELRRKSLFLFVEIFPVYSSSHGNGNHGGAKPEDFRDGMIITRILKESVDPLHFSDLVPSSRNPYTELTKITTSMKKYCAEKKRGHFIPFYLMPNIDKIVSTDDTKDVCRLLQLLLVCAVNSPRNGELQTKINKMEAEVQTELKGAIDELMISKAAFEGLLQKAWNEKSRLNRELDRFKKMYSDLKNELSLVTEKKDDEISEKLRVISDLQSQIDSLIIKSQSKAETRQEIKVSTISSRELELESQVQSLEAKVQELEKKNGWLKAQVGPKSPESEHYLRKDLSEMAQQLATAHRRVTEVESVILFHEKCQREHESAILQAESLRDENERLTKSLLDLQQRQIDNSVNNARQQSDQNALLASVASKFMPTAAFFRNSMDRLSYQQRRRSAATQNQQSSSSPRALTGEQKPNSDQNFEYYF